MGFLTVVVIRNDALHAFAEDPELFGKKIIEGIHQANREMKEVSVGFNGYANYIDVHPSRHADHHTLYINAGNCVTELNPYTPNFKQLKERGSKFLVDMVKSARSIVKSCSQSLAKKD